jgi:hypothetical protein
MLPHELEERTLSLPPTTDHTIALITSTGLRHKRFAYRLQQEFGDLVVAWFEVGGARSGPAEERQRAADERLFELEVRELRRSAKLAPRPVTDPNASEFVRELERVDPYFFVSLGGPLYGPEVLGCARGVAINQHAGWSPTFRGTRTVEWALYHRRLDCVGTTVHVATANLDAGPVFRRAHATLTPWDTPEMCFARVVAFGTELLCETVGTIIHSKEIVAYDQPLDRGDEYVGAQLDAGIEEAIRRDFSNGWLEDALRRERRF